jgi:hypothetical protein
MNDLSGTVNLLESAQYAAGKNKIINGDFGVWQRGTSFTVASPTGGYTADRMACFNESGANATFSQQTFTPGTAPVSGYEGAFFLRSVTTASSGATYISQRIEDVRAFAGQTVTVSYWAKCASGTVSSAGFYLQNFGSGGSATVFASLSSATITTSWQRFTHTIAIPSIASKTIGTSSYLEFQILRYTAAATVDLWGVQVEAGSTASPFQTATGTKQGELAACQRYCIVYSGDNTIGNAPASSTTAVPRIPIATPTALRGTPTMTISGTLQTFDGVTATNVTSLGTIYASQNITQVQANVASGLTQYRNYSLFMNSGSLTISAEL